MSPFVLLVIIFLVGLFAILSLLPASFQESDEDLLVQMQD